VAEVSIPGAGRGATRRARRRDLNEAGGSRPVPEAWIGRAVELIFVSGSSTEYADGHLEEVNDRGIVLKVKGHGEYPARPLFFPWSAVIQLAEASDG
jgi:hypothetical protein